MRFGPFGNVEEGAGDGRDRDAVADRDFVRGKFAAMHLDPGAPSRPHLPAPRRIDVDPWPISRQPPERRRALVAEKRARSHREDRGEPLAALGEWAWPERVDLAVHGLQPPHGEPALDGSSSHTKGCELALGQHTVLPSHQVDDLPFPGGASEPLRHMWRLSSEAPSVLPRSPRIGGARWRWGRC
jgi:hypothetical protein